MLSDVSNGGVGHLRIPMLRCIGRAFGAARTVLATNPGDRAGRHRMVDEIWYIFEGRGEKLRRDGDFEEVLALK